MNPAEHGPPREDLEHAANLLSRGGLVAFPTETFYGLAAAANQSEALERLSELKARPADSPFPLLISEPAALFEVVLPEVGLWQLVSHLVERYWPGPLTLVLPARASLHPVLLSASGRVAVRQSSHPVAAALTQLCGTPITATSANFRGHPPPRCEADLRASGLDRQVDLLLAGGTTPGGPPSTLLSVEASAATILREGAISRNDLWRDLHSLGCQLR